MTTSAILYATLMIASGAIRIGVTLLAIWAIIRLVDRLRTPKPVQTEPSVEQSASPAVEA